MRGCRDLFPHVREAFVVKVVRFGEGGVKYGEVPVGNWCADLTKQWHAMHGWYCVLWSGVVDPSHGRQRGVLIINYLLNGVCACMFVSCIV